MRRLTCFVVELPKETNARLAEEQMALEGAVQRLLAKFVLPNSTVSHLRAPIPIHENTEAMGSGGTPKAVVPALGWRILESSGEFR
ncbi:hypothetical protein DICSQDRAFT_133255 [Dichomitus squalens LYAD-421 SS1]|uniref:uncharacterized protein n=1 Tax=Dichomitus squalens (strain LYAD-421) TaxID=732165 RepID=UPI000441399B|nr:uncharacterized protein DICSQDRAFT_133255 [Dichomitus squalens LYAD-421 SS1]EJF64487.1 hypothetical protein DICSQDRAFT_133255 [Dichomitus squalens LYAD-421 SS1]